MVDASRVTMKEIGAVRHCTYLRTLWQAAVYLMNNISLYLGNGHISSSTISSSLSTW